MRLFLSRVGRDGESCDRCRTPIPPHGLCSMASNGMLYCQGCASVLTDRPTANDLANSRLRGDRTPPETP